MVLIFLAILVLVSFICFTFNFLSQFGFFRFQAKTPNSMPLPRLFCIFYTWCPCPSFFVFVVVKNFNGSHLFTMHYLPQVEDLFPQKLFAEQRYQNDNTLVQATDAKQKSEHL